MSKWEFQKSPEMGGASGAAFRNPLSGTGHAIEDLVAREAIQNSCDAQLDSVPRIAPRIDFTFKDLTGKAKREFLKVAGLSEEYLQHARAQNFSSDDVLKRLDADAKPLRLLYISDWNTKGLGGAVHDARENADFHKFCFAIGDADKVDNEGSGGSYGYGKSVFAESSNLRSIFVYSVFEPSKDTENASARLMGLTWLDKHRIKDQPFNGRGCLGECVEGKEFVIKPFVDDAAHKLAVDLGFELRKEGETGCSILVLDSKLNAQKLTKSIETNWWPRLLDSSLDVRLYEDGESLGAPQPRKRDELKPFITCYDFINEIEIPQTPYQTKSKLNKLNNHALGEWAAVALDYVEYEDGQDAPYGNCVAIMRHPKMVVEYIDMGRAYRLPIAGVFVADDAVDTPLKMSEPPAHDRWDEESARISENQREIVGTILRRLRSNIQKFQDSLQSREETDSSRVPELEKILGGLFKSRSKIPPSPVPPAEPRIVEVRVNEERLPAGNQAICRATVSIRIKDTAEIDSDHARLTGVFQVLAQDTQRVDETLASMVKKAPDEAEQSDEKSTIQLPISKQDWQEVEFESEPFNADWSVKFSLSAEKANV